MVGIDSVVDAYFFAGFPLGKYAVGVHIDILVILAPPTGVMNVEFRALDVDNLSIDPFVLGVLYVHILP